MLTRVDVQSENPFYMNIRDARPTDSIIVEKIDGLNPPTVDLFMGEYARDGGSYNGRRVQFREVNFVLRLNPNYKLNESVSGLRTMLYKTFMDPFTSSDNLMIVLKDDELPDRYISGYVEKFESDIFSDEAIVEITMLCPNPYLIDVVATESPTASANKLFTYNGSAETGLEIWSTVTVATDILTFDLNGDTFTLNYDFLVGDEIYVNTNPGSREITRTRNIAGVDTPANILYALDWSDSKWLDIHSLDNELKVYGSSTTDIVANLTNLSFRANHWGI